jgi:hypothetical protein
VDRLHLSPLQRAGNSMSRRSGEEQRHTKDGVRNGGGCDRGCGAPANRRASIHCKRGGLSRVLAITQWLSCDTASASRMRCGDIFWRRFHLPSALMDP